MARHHRCGRVGAFPAHESHAHRVDYGGTWRPPSRSIRSAARTEAFIKDGTVQANKAVSLTATDSSTIEADGGGAAIALSLGGAPGRRSCHRRGGLPVRRQQCDQHGWRRILTQGHGERQMSPSTSRPRNRFDDRWP